MKQMRFGFKAPKTIKSQSRSYDRANLEIARTILADPEQWGGHDAFPLVWARLVVERLEMAAAA